MHNRDPPMWRYAASGVSSIELTLHQARTVSGNFCGARRVYIRSECRWFFFLTWRWLFSTGDYFRDGLVTRFRFSFSASLRQMANATSSPLPPLSGNVVPADKPVQSDREDDDSPRSITMRANTFRLQVSWTQHFDEKLSKSKASL